MSILKACIIAFGTYSKFPVPYFEWKEKDMKYSICFFPFVGVLLGAAEWLWFWICVNYGMGTLFKAAGAVIINILVTGGIHIDGYMDTMDALHSYQPVEKKLEILKDAHIGAFAVIMLSVLLLAYIGALPGIEFNNVPLFASTFVFSRILSGLSVVLFKGAKKGILSPYRSINYLLQKSEAFQSVHHVTFILCYTVLYNFFALVFSLIRVRKHWWDDITQGKQ